VEWSCWIYGTSWSGELHDLVTGFVGVLLLFAIGGGALAASTRVIVEGRPRVILWFAPTVVAIGVVVTLASRGAWTSALCGDLTDDDPAMVSRHGAPAYFEVRTTRGDGTAERTLSLQIAFANCVFWTGVAAMVMAFGYERRRGRSLLRRY
jgi:hypothetical protein